MRAASPEAVGRLISGSARMAAAGVIGPVLFIGLGILDINTTRGEGPGIAYVGGIAAGFIGPLVAFGGVRAWSRAVERDEDARRMREGPILPELKGAQVTAAWHTLFAILVTAVVIMLVNNVPRAMNEEVWAWGAGTLGWLCALGWTVRNVLVSVRCGQVAARMNARGLAGAFVAARWVGVVVAALMVVCGMAGVVMYRLRDEIEASPSLVVDWTVAGFRTMSMLLVAMLIVGMGVWPVMLLVMMARLARVRTSFFAGPLVVVRAGGQGNNLGA